MLYTKTYPIWFTLIFACGLFIGVTASALGCGDDPACDDGSCDPNPEPDAGTTGDGNPINKEDGGTNGGDATTDDTGGDAGKDPDCSAAAYPKLNKTLYCCVNTCGDTDCYTTVDNGKCALSCKDTFHNIPLDDERLTINDSGFTVDFHDGDPPTVCTEKN